jgi:hypothetical protein
VGEGGVGGRQDGKLVQPHPDPADPLLVRLAGRKLRLELDVVDDAPLLGVDQEHLAGLQPPFLHDLRFGDRQHANLGGHHDNVIVGDHVAGRPQPVAVQRGADPDAVGEGDRGRSVPRLHHRSVVLVERAPALVHQRVLLPRLRNHHHHRVRQRVAGHHQQLQGVVEAGGIGLAFVDQRIQLAQVLAQNRRAHHALARAHPVEVALDRVDLTVVRDHPVRVSQLPARERVGRKALVHQRNRRFDPGIGEVAVVAAHLVGQQQTLVHDGAGRHRRHEILAAVLQLQRLDLVARGLADHVKLPLKRVRNHDVVAAADEDLPDHRFALAHARRHRHVTVHGHIAPPQHHLAFSANAALELLLARQARGVLARQKNHADPVFPGRRQLHALREQLLAVKGVRYLDQDAGAVAVQGVGTHRAAVVQVAQDQQRVVDKLVAAVSLDVDDKADAAGVVLVRGRVKPASLRGFHRGVVGSRLHRLPPKRPLAGKSPRANLMQRIIASNEK